jgi:hypothetical protein
VPIGLRQQTTGSIQTVQQLIRFLALDRLAAPSMAFRMIELEAKIVCG